MCLHAEWIPYMKAYRVYNPLLPHNTVAYEDDENKLAKDGIAICDSDTMHVEDFSDCYNEF